MSDEEEEVFFDCVECFGANGRARRSDGSNTCRHDKCKRDYAAKRRRGSDNNGDISSLPLPKAPQHKCRKIKDVLGVSLCLTSQMSGEEKRTGRKTGDDDIQCQVRGGFGGARDKVEDLIPDTRWVKLDELVDAMDHSQLKKLFTFSRQLVDVLERAEERLRVDEDE
jgi:hypothetical protein